MCEYLRPGLETETQLRAQARFVHSAASLQTESSPRGVSQALSGLPGSSLMVEHQQPSWLCSWICLLEDEAGNESFLHSISISHSSKEVKLPFLHLRALEGQQSFSSSVAQSTPSPHRMPTVNQFILHQRFLPAQREHNGGMSGRHTPTNKRTMEQEKGVLFVCERNYAIGTLVQPVAKRGRKDKKSYEQKDIPFLIFLSRRQGQPTCWRNLTKGWPSTSWECGSATEALAGSWASSQCIHSRDIKTIWQIPGQRCFKGTNVQMLSLHTCPYLRTCWVQECTCTGDVTLFLFSPFSFYNHPSAT